MCPKNRARQWFRMSDRHRARNLSRPEDESKKAACDDSFYRYTIANLV